MSPKKQAILKYDRIKMLEKAMREVLESFLLFLLKSASIYVTKNSRIGMITMI